MSYGTIYKITNTKTGKVYIGKTTKSLNDRLQGHINNAAKGNNFKLSIAIRKYGKESFIIEPIDFADTRTELSEKEVYYIYRDRRNMCQDSKRNCHHVRLTKLYRIKEYCR